MSTQKRYIVRKSDGKRLEITPQNKDILKAKYLENKDAFDLVEEGGEVKKKDIPQVPQTPVQTGGEIPQQNVGSVGSLVGGLAPTPQDIASQSAGGNVASPVVLPEPTKINEANIPIQGVGGNVPVNIQASNIPKVSLDKQNIQPSVVEGIQSPEPIEVPTEDIRNRFETEWGDQGDALRLQEEQKYFESGKKSDLDKVISDIYSEIKSNYTVNEIREGKHIDNAKAQFSDFVNAHKDEIPVSLRNRYIIEAGKLFEDISKQKKEEQTQERIVRNIDNEAFDLGEINDAGFTKFNEDYKSGKVKNSDLIWNDLFYQQNPEKALQLYKDLTGEDFVSDNLIPELQFDDVALAKEAVDKMREYSLQNKRKSIDRKIIDLAISTGNKENINQFVDDYKSELVKQAIGYEPLMEKWDSLKEYYRLAGKKDKTEADNKKMIELTKSINQNTENVFYDINTQDWVNKRNDTGLASENWNKYKSEIANTYSGNKAMSNLFKDIEKVSAELEYLKPILADQQKATKQTIKNTSFARGIVNPNEYIQEKLTNALTPEDAQYDTHQYDPMNQSDIANRISELKTRLNAMVEILIENKNPNNNPEAGFLDGLFNTDAVKIQEDNKKLIREANRLGHNLTEADLDYLEDDFSKKLGSTIRESLPVGAEIMFHLFVGNKVKGVMGIAELANRLHKGNKYKKILANLIDKGYNVLNQEMAFQSAGENVGTGTGELVFENIAEKMMPKGWNKVTKLVTRMVAGTTGETLAEYGGKFTSELVDGKSLKDAWDITTEGGVEELLLTAASSFIMAGAPATLNVFGENVNSDGVNEGNLLKLKSELENVPQKSEATEDFIRTLEESYPEEVIQRQGEKFFTESNIELYADILEKPKEEWTDDEVMFINGMDGFYDSSKDLLPKDEVKLFELFKDKFDNRGEEVKSPQDKLQEQRDKVAGIEQQKTEKNDQKDQERVSGEVKVGEEPIKEKPIEEASPKETEAGGVLQAQEEVEPITADVTNLKSEVDNVAEGMNPMAQKKVFDALTDYTEQVATETDLKGGKLIDEVANRIDQNEELNLTKDDILESKEELIDIIKQKQKQNESKRIRDNQNGETKNAEGAEKRVQLEEQRRGGETDNGNTEGQTGQWVSGTQQEVIKDTEEQLTSPPPETEMGEASVELEKGAISIEGKGSSKSLAIIGEGVNENLLSTKEDVEQAKSLYEKRGWYISEQLGFGGVITVFAKDKKTLKSIIDKKYHDQIDSIELKKEKSVDEKKIKESGKKIAETIRKAKFNKDIESALGKLQSGGLVPAIWDGAVEVVATSIEAGASVTQAVSDGLRKFRESDWYKGLSDDGKKQADAFFENKVGEQYKKAEESIKSEEKKGTPPPKTPDTESNKKEGTPKERRKQFLNRAKNDPDIDERTRRFLAEADEMYEVESNKWANADADRLIEAYEKEGNTDELFEDIKSGDNMSESVQAMLALKLARRLDSQNKNKEASEVYEWIDETARGSGRFIQALREQASPDGVKRAKEAEWKEQKTQAMDGKTASKQNTNEEVVNDAKTGTDTAVSNFNENIDKNTDIDNAVKNVANKSVKRKETASRRARKNINKEKAYRNKLKDDFKKNKGNYLSMSATGLSSSGIEYAGNIAASYIRQGVYNVAEIIANVKEFFKNELDYELTNQDVSQIAGKIASDDKIIKENLETTIKDIVKNHFNNKEEYGKRLAEKLKEEAGLSDVEAKYLEDQVMKSFDDAVRKTMEEELKRMFNRAQNNGTPKRVKTFTERVIDAYRYGALDNSKFADQFGEYFGFVSLTNEDKVQISKLAEALETAPEGSHIQKKMMGEFSKHLDELDKKGWKFKAKEMAKTAIEFWYTSILSGVTTLYRGAKGIIQTSTADMFVEALKNPRLFFSPKGFIGGLDALAKGFKKGSVTAGEIMRSGYNAMDSANKLELTPSKLNDFINKKQKGVWNNTVKLWYYLPTKMVRSLIASDALLKMASKDLYAYTKNYNVLLTEGMDRKSKDFWNEMHNRMANSKADYDIALEEARGEKKAMEDAGVSTKGFNEKLRAYEILEEKRDISVNEYSTWKAEKAGINQTPQGLVGSFYEMITTKLERFPLGKLVVPFTRIPSNAMNMWLDWSPWGFKRAAFGYGTGMSRAKTEKKLGTAKVKKMMIGTQDMTADDRVELLIKATIGTATWGVLFWQMGLDDDDENKFIDLSYNGYGDYKENESLRKQGWRPYSMRLKIGGKWSDWIEYRDAPMGFVFSSLSSVNDELKYGKEKKGKLTKADTQDLILHGLTHSLLFVKEQNYMQGVSNLMKAFEGKGVGSKLGKYGVDTQTDFVKSVLFPNTYKQSYGTYKALTGKPQNIKTRFNEGILKYSFQRMVSDVPFLEDMESANEGEMFDVLGYPIVRKIRDVNPILSLIYAEDFDTHMRDSKQYENHRLLIDKGLKVTFYWPKTYQGRELTSIEKATVSKAVAKDMNDFITRNYDKLKEMDKNKAQELLDKRKSKYQNIERKKYLK